MQQTITVRYVSNRNTWVSDTRGPDKNGTTTYDTKSAAVSASKSIAKRRGWKLIVEKKNGGQDYTRNYGSSNQSQGMGGFGQSSSSSSGGFGSNLEDTVNDILGF